jgi:hypothetical protein
MVGGEGPEKIKKVRRGSEERDISPKIKPKRGGVREISHAGDSELPVAEPVLEMPPVNTDEQFPEAATAAESLAAPEVVVSEKPKFQRKQETPLDPTEAMKQIGRKKEEILRKIASGRLNEEEKEGGEILHVVFPISDKRRFGKLTQEEQDMLWDTRKKANNEIDDALEKWLEKNKEKRSLGERGQLADDKSEAGAKGNGVYSNGSNPHDAGEILREKPKVRKELGLEKELSAEHLEFLEGEARRLAKEFDGLYLKHREYRKRPILFNEVADVVEQLIEDITGKSDKSTRDWADKIVSEVLEK